MKTIVNGSWAIVAGILVLLDGRPAPAQATHSVTVHDGLVSVRAMGAPLSDVFDSLVRHGLVEVVGADRLSGPVFITLDAVPADAMVTALLAEYRFTITSRPRPGDARGPLMLVQVSSALTPPAPVQGPIVIPELEAVRAAEQDAEEPDPEDDADGAAALDRAEERADRESEVAELERAGAFQPTAPVGRLEDLSGDANPLVRIRALTALEARHSRVALPLLVQGLADEDAAVRDCAVELLGARTDQESLARLGEVLVRSTDTSLRHGAFRVLALRASPTSVPLVEAVASDADATIKAAAATFLAEMARRAGGPARTTPRPSLPPR